MSMQQFIYRCARAGNVVRKYFYDDRFSFTTGRECVPLEYDDFLDLLGKNSGDDFLDQKITLPVIFAYTDGDDKERIFWHKTMRDGNVEDGDFDTALHILQRHDAIERSISEAIKYANAAEHSVTLVANQSTGDLALLESLTEAARFAAHRQS